MVATLMPYPLRARQKVDKTWRQNLRKLVVSCYVHHKCEMLLKFCSKLSKYPRTILKYVDNKNNTTSLYHKPSSKLFVTFRNENMLYDKKQTVSNRRPLMLRNMNIMPPSYMNNTSREDEADVFICCECDTELTSSAEMEEHNKFCCVNEEPAPPRADTPDVLDVDQANFLGYFQLLSKSGMHPVPVKDTIMSPTSLRKSARRTFAYNRFTKFYSIPFSSPAGITLSKRSKHIIPDDYYKDCLERIERHCIAKPSNIYETGNMKEHKIRKVKQTLRDSINKRWCHHYRFPHEHNKMVLSLDSQLKIFNCKQVRVRLQKQDLNAVMKELKLSCKLSETCNPYVASLEIKMKSENEPKPLYIINLCSSDEEEMTH